MYAPAHFAMEDAEAATAFIDAHPLATLTAAGPDGPMAAFAPMLVERDGAGRPVALIGHLARMNPFGERVAEGAKALAIFHGPDAYVSPSLYASKREHGKVVPTWNYMAVEVAGSIGFTKDAEALRGLVTRLTERMERDLAQPWAVSDAPADYLGKMLNAIIGVRIEITSLTGTRKLSQNRNEADRAGVLSGLSQSNETAARMVASEMSRLDAAKGG
jgi:transcriptional regulator